MHNKIFIHNRSIYFSFFLMTFFIACSSGDKETPAKAPAVKTAAPPATVVVQSLHPQYTITVPGELKPWEQVSVYAKLPGFIQKMYAERGQQVKKGQLLALLEAPEMQQSYLSDLAGQQKLHNDYLFAKQAYDRLQEAAATAGAVAAIELERAESVMMAAKATYDAGRAGTAHSSEMQQYLRITAPFDGIITDRYLSAGALAGTGTQQPIFSMATTRKLRLTVQLPEKHADAISENMMAGFSVSARPGKIFSAKLSRSSGLINNTDRSVTLEFDVNNQNGLLQGGEYAQVQLRLQRKEPGIWVPSKSILNTQSGTFVILADTTMHKKVPVREGIQLDSLTEVFGELTPGIRILKKPEE